MSTISKDLGMVTAYAYAVAGGYTGTEAEFEELLGSIADTLEEFENFSVTVTTLPAGSSATASYADGVLSLGIPKGDKGDTGEQGETGLTPDFSIGTVETLEPGESATATITGTAENPVLSFGIPQGAQGDPGEVTQEAFDVLENSIVKSFGSIEPYLYRKNAYMNAGNIIALNGYDLYRIPANSGDIVSITWDESFYGALGGMYIFQVEHADGTIGQLLSGAPCYVSLPAKLCAVMFGIEDISDVVALYVCVQHGREEFINLAVNRPTTQLVNDAKSVEVVTGDNFIQSQLYYRVAKDWGVFSSPYNTKIVKMHAGDRITIGKTVPGVSGTAMIVNASGTVTQLTAPEYTATEDCIAFIYDNSTISGDIVYYPADPLLISSENVYGALNVDRQFNGLSGVAFGTSLTYRASTSYGFLTRLAELSGITFDNQGIGSSVIKGNMLTAIKAYTGYADKTVCLLEGFVNDWYTGQPLGTYTDATEDTVCGCVRSALNYILSQNANLTVFLILDHYGRNNGGVNCATTAVNSNNVTQYQFYEEIAKVAESLGIPVIKEYEVSQISENTPQYLADNIHLNALGAIQSGQAIWSQMKQYYPNEQ